MQKSFKPDHVLRRYCDIRELIASVENPTPLVKINRLISRESFELYLKLEWFNPFGSIKDRVALFMLKGMEERGELDGKELVEPTSGNTGIALAALAHSLVRSKDTSRQYVMPNQYANPENVRAHYETTGPEIWKQTEGQVEFFFAGQGTCGTLTGVGRFLKEKNPNIKIIAIEPQKGHRIPGMKNLEESKPPAILDRSVIDQVIRVDDEPAYEMTKRLFREEGLIVGPSTGAIVHAAVEFGNKENGLGVAISPDSGIKYTSFFSDMIGDEGKPRV